MISLRGKMLEAAMKNTASSVLNDPSSMTPAQYAATMASYLALMNILPDEDKIQITETYLKTLIEIGKEQGWDLDMLNLGDLRFIPTNIKAKALADVGLECENEEEVNSTFKEFTSNFIEILKEEL